METEIELIHTHSTTITLNNFVEEVKGRQHNTSVLTVL